MAIRYQHITVWLLPIILIGGLFYPLLGYLVVAMMGFFLPFSFFMGRYWCWRLCPRGAFLDIVISKISPHKPAPVVFSRNWFRWSIFALFMIFLASRIANSGGTLLAVGAVFVSMCILTTVISAILGITMRHRAWCAVCPMGLLQEKIGNLAHTNKPKPKS